MVFQTTPAWLIQWLARVETILRPQGRLAHHLIGYLQSITRDTAEIQKPKPLIILKVSLADADIYSTFFCLVWVSTFPPDIADYLSEPLRSQWDNIQQ